MSSFFLALKNNDTEQCLSLIKEGLILDTVNEKEETLLFCVMQNGNQNLFKTLLLANAPLTKDGSSLLMHAIIEHEEELVIKLIEMGVDLDYCNKEGDSALITAATMGNLAIIQMLIDSGCSINLQNNRGKTALDIARDEKESEIIHFLSLLQQ